MLTPVEEFVRLHAVAPPEPTRYNAKPVDPRDTDTSHVESLRTPTPNSERGGRDIRTP